MLTHPQCASEDVNLNRNNNTYNTEILIPLSLLSQNAASSSRAAILSAPAPAPVPQTPDFTLFEPPKPWESDTPPDFLEKKIWLKNNMVNSLTEKYRYAIGIKRYVRKVEKIDPCLPPDTG